MKASDSSPFEQGCLTSNVVAPTDIFKKALFEKS